MVGGTITLPDVYKVDQIDVAVRSEINVILNPSLENLTLDNNRKCFRNFMVIKWDSSYMRML